MLKVILKILYFVVIFLFKWINTVFNKKCFNENIIEYFALFIYIKNINVNSFLSFI